MPSTEQAANDIIDEWADDLEEQGYAECIVCDAKLHAGSIEQMLGKLVEHVEEEHDAVNEAGFFGLPPR